MDSPPVHWTDQAGVPHRLRLAGDLSSAERRQLDVLRQQYSYTALLYSSELKAPAIGHALPNMMRMMLRILLPNVTEQEIAAFDHTDGHDLLTKWWVITDAPA